jgi:hypothetical protein
MLLDLRTLNSANHYLTCEDKKALSQRVMQYGDSVYQSALSSKEYRNTGSDVVLSILISEALINDAFIFQLNKSGIANVSITGLKGFINRLYLKHSCAARRSVGSLIGIVYNSHREYTYDVLSVILNAVNAYASHNICPQIAKQCFFCGRNYIDDVCHPPISQINKSGVV